MPVFKGFKGSHLPTERHGFSPSSNTHTHLLPLHVYLSSSWIHRQSWLLVCAQVPAPVRESAKQALSVAHHAWLGRKKECGVHLGYNIRAPKCAVSVALGCIGSIEQGQSGQDEIRQFRFVNRVIVIVSAWRSPVPHARHS